MHSTRKIIRAFLASPGDLKDERIAIRAGVDEFNESWANALGYQVELIGWEDTVAGVGRPQELINQDVDRCDLFLGMIWKRWGTPPDNNGAYSSGFHEEFERSMARYEKTKSPQISIFFKEIPEEFMADPGDDLKKVIDFRKKIIVGKKILFQQFSTAQDMEKLARKCVTAYVNTVRAEYESSDPDELRAKGAQSGSTEAVKDDKERDSSPLTAEGLTFLEGLVDRVRRPDSLDELSAGDVARFRLLANSISKQGNEEMNLGVHDINILFTARTEGMELGEREMRCLARLGFQHLASENVPLWCWYSALEDSQIDPAVISSVTGANENEKVGAISVLTALTLDLPTYDKVITREWLINDWFSEDSPARVRTAALGYLAKCGTLGDMEVARKEYDRSAYETSRSALECMVGILLRTGQAESAQKLVLESQFESLNVDLLMPVLDGFEGLETSELLLGLEHQNSQIRLRAMQALHSRGELDIGMAERLSDDSNALVRNEAVAVLTDLGKSFDIEEIKKTLIRPQKQSWFGPLGSGGVAVSEKIGEELFEQFRLDMLKRLSESQLEKKIKESLPHNDAAYFALVEGYFRNHADKLRRDVDDRFNMYFEERIPRLVAQLGDSSFVQDLVKKTKGLKEFMRKELTRRGLNVLCVAQKPEDLQRIRANLQDGYAGVSKLDAEYFRRHGEWTDIPLLANAEEPGRGGALLTISNNEEFRVEVARAITSIGKKHSISDLLSLEMPAVVLKKTIELCAESRFATISRDALLALFNHKSDEVRKAAAILAVRAFPAKRIKSILDEYVGSDSYRYYNVIHWLDLGVSMRRVDAKKVARAAAS